MEKKEGPPHSTSPIPGNVRPHQYADGFRGKQRAGVLQCGCWVDVGAHVNRAAFLWFLFFSPHGPGYIASSTSAFNAFYRLQQRATPNSVTSVVVVFYSVVDIFKASRVEQEPL